MQKKLYFVLSFLLVAAFVLSACGQAPAEEPAAEEPTVKVCEVTDAGGVDDKSFNASAWKGVQDAMAELGVEGKVLESQQQTDYEKNINAFIEEGCDLIVPVGFLLADATTAAAEANPDQNFAIVDVDWIGLDNVANLAFQTDEAAFMAGYLAAAMTQTGAVGTFGGVQIPTVTIFMDGFYYGAMYYNEQHGTEVSVLGWDPEAGEGLFTNNFDSLDDGRIFAQNLYDEGADIVLPVAGPVGLGSAALADELGVEELMVIGVDADLYFTDPENQHVYLTSITKRMDSTVQQVIEMAMNDEFEGGVIVGSLANGGVDIAPYHDFEDDVPEALQAEIAAIREGIVSGEITVGGM